MEKAIRWIDAINERVGRWASWLTLALVLLIMVDVLCRYVFRFTFIWVGELEIYLFAYTFLFGAGYTLRHDKHVRVDVFYDRMTERGKAWVNLLGALVLLLPWCLVVLWVSTNYALNALAIQERSPQAGGLPAVYLLKAGIPIGFFFLLLQGVALVLRSLQTLLSPR